VQEIVETNKNNNLLRKTFFKYDSTRRIVESKEISFTSDTTNGELKFHKMFTYSKNGEHTVQFDNYRVQISKKWFYDERNVLVKEYFDFWRNKERDVIEYEY
jgi:hypothetical protein